MSWRGRDQGRRPAREGNDHVHPDLWSEADHNRYEDRVADQLRALRAEVHSVVGRMAWIMGGLAVLAFLGPILVVVVLRFILPPGS
jgi:hypothetical protein